MLIVCMENQKRIDCANTSRKSGHAPKCSTALQLHNNANSAFLAVCVTWLSQVVIVEICGEIPALLFIALLACLLEI